MEIIDIHTHGIAGYDTRTSDYKDILKLAEIHGSAGVQAIMPTVYPAPIQKMRENMTAIKKAMEEAAPPAKNKTASSRIIGIHLEGPFLNPKMCGSLDKTTFLEPKEHYLRKLIEGFEDVIRIITLSPELDGALGLISRLRDMGILVSMGHSDATYKEAMAGFMKGAKGITHIFNAMRHIHHREPGIAGLGLLNQDIYIEVIADPFHLHPNVIELIFRIKNPEKIIIVSDSVKGSKTFSFEDKGIANSSGRLMGGSMTAAQAGRRLVDMGFDKGAVNRAMTENPERYLS